MIPPPVTPDDFPREWPCHPTLTNPARVGRAVPGAPLQVVVPRLSPPLRVPASHLTVPPALAGWFVKGGRAWLLFSWFWGPDPGPEAHARLVTLFEGSGFDLAWRGRAPLSVVGKDGDVALLKLNVSADLATALLEARPDGAPGLVPRRVSGAVRQTGPDHLQLWLDLTP